MAALRGYGAQSFGTYDIVFVRGRCIQEWMMAHRAINSGELFYHDARDSLVRECRC